MLRMGLSGRQRVSVNWRAQSSCPTLHSAALLSICCLFWVCTFDYLLQGSTNSNAYRPKQVAYIGEAGSGRLKRIRSPTFLLCSCPLLPSRNAHQGCQISRSLPLSLFPKRSQKFRFLCECPNAKMLQPVPNKQTNKQISKQNPTGASRTHTQARFGLGFQAFNS